MLFETSLFNVYTASFEDLLLSGKKYVKAFFLEGPKCPPDSWATQTYGEGPAGTLT